MITDELKETYYDDLLNKQDMSLLQIKALLGSCLIYFIEGLHVSLTGPIFIPIMLNYKITQVKGCFVSSSLMLFMAFGSLCSGFLTNKFVRKKIIIFCLLTISTFSLISVIPSWFSLLISRCIIGFSLGIMINVNTNNLSEVLPLKLRSFWIIFVSSTFSIGAIISCEIIKMNINRLGILFSIISIPSSIALILFNLYYNENPRYLILIGRNEEAFEVIEKFLLLDHHKLTGYEKIQITKSIDRGINKEVKITGKFKFIFRRYGNITFNLCIIWVLYSIIINGGIFSLFVSFANNGIFISSFSDINLSNIRGLYLVIQIFYTFFAVSTIVSGLFTEIKCCGRKYTIFFGFLLSTLTSFYILLIQEKSKILYFIATCIINISFNAINSYTIEVYPTRVRDFAVGYLQFVSRIVGFSSNLLALLLNYKIKQWMFYINAIIGVLGLLFTLMLPFDTYQRKLDDIMTKKPKERKNEIPIIGN
jgi:MFS family permease